MSKRKHMPDSWSLDDADNRIGWLDDKLATLTAQLSEERAENARLQTALNNLADEMADDIMAMGDDEVMAYTRARGEDPVAIAAHMREGMNKLLAEYGHPPMREVNDPRALPAAVPPKGEET